VPIGEIERGIALQESKNPGSACDLAVWLSTTLALYDDRILDFRAEDARIWGRLSAEIGSAGADLMIAATGLAHGAAVATGNVADFRPTGVEVIDPFAPR